MSSNAVRVVLADHQVLFRQSLTKILVDAGWIIAATTDSGENLEQLLCDSQATLLIIDRMLPRVSVLDFCSMQTTRNPALQVLILTGYEHEAQALQLQGLHAGAAGCLSKDHGGDVYLEAVNVLVRDMVLFKRSDLRAAWGAVQLNSTPTNIKRDVPLPQNLPPPLNVLTPRELEILALIADSQPNPEIAEALNISTNTVMKHVSHIISKLAVRNRMEAGLLYLKISRE